MATGRIIRTVQFEEILEHHTTFLNDPNDPLVIADDVNKAVCLIDNKTVGFLHDGADIIGILKVVESDGIVVVQDAGYKEDVPYSSLPVVGDRVVADGSGSVKPAGSSAAVGSHKVVSVDTSAETCILKLD